MVRGAKRKIMVRIARACGDLSLQHCDGFGELSAIGEMLCPRQSEGDRVPRTASGRKQPDIPDHSLKFGGSLPCRS
jgi:hypothetical protein